MLQQFDELLLKPSIVVSNDNPRIQETKQLLGLLECYYKCTLSDRTENWRQWEEAQSETISRTQLGQSDETSPGELKSNREIVI